MAILNANIMRAIAPRFSGEYGTRQGEIIDAVGPVLEATLTEYAMNPDIRAAHFLAQICHKSAGFRTTKEFATAPPTRGARTWATPSPGRRAPAQGSWANSAHRARELRKYRENPWAWSRGPP